MSGEGEKDEGEKGEGEGYREWMRRKSVRVRRMSGEGESVKEDVGGLWLGCRELYLYNTLIRPCSEVDLLVNLGIPGIPNVWEA